MENIGNLGLIVSCVIVVAIALLVIFVAVNFSACSGFEVGESDVATCKKIIEKASEIKELNNGK